MEEMWLAENVTPELFIFTISSLSIVGIIILIREQINKRKNGKTPD